MKIEKIESGKVTKEKGLVYRNKIYGAFVLYLDNKQFICFGDKLKFDKYYQESWVVDETIDLVYKIKKEEE